MRSRAPAQLPGDPGWAKGVPVEQARAWAVDRAEFDGPGLCDELNTLPQFLADIDGATVHFVHVRAEREDATPLLLLHGWPGTVVEMIDLAGPLSAPESPDEPAYHVVIPSHPGTGLSGRTPDDGWGVARTARACASLMAGLGYEDYIGQAATTARSSLRTSAAWIPTMCAVSTSTPRRSASSRWARSTTTPARR